MLYIMYEGQAHHGHVYRIVDTGPSDLINMEANFTAQSKIKVKAAPGQIYEIRGEFNDNGGITYHRSTLKWLQAHPDAASFSIAHNANQAYIQARNKALRADWREGLAPLRKAYHDARGAQRNVILAQIIAAVTS